MEPLYCPFDKTELEARSEYHNERWNSCPKCGLTYPRVHSQEQIDNEARRYVERWVKELKELGYKKRNLLEKLRVAKDVNLLEDFSVLIQ